MRRATFNLGLNHLHLVLDMETAKEQQERAALARLEILREQLTTLTTLCIFNGQWLECAPEILQKMELNECFLQMLLLRC